MNGRALFRNFCSTRQSAQTSVNEQQPDSCEPLLAAVREAMQRQPEAFDAHGYLAANSDVASAGVDALEHYLTRGFKEGRRPVGTLDADWYLQTYQDVSLSGMEPLTHYLLWGVSEGRLPRDESDTRSTAEGWQSSVEVPPKIKSMKATILSSGLFDIMYYLVQNPDVVAAGIEPIEHYLQYGENEGRRPNPWFEPNFYRDRYLSVASPHSPLVDYVEVGSRLLRDPSQDFSAWQYWNANRARVQGQLDVLHWHLHVGRHHGIGTWAVSASDPATILNSGAFDTVFYRALQDELPESDWDLAVHYLLYGSDQGLHPNRFFDTAYYLANNPDVARGSLNPFIHFLRFGWQELRNPSADFDVWWYWTFYMDPTCEVTNPLAHFLSVGKSCGFVPKPTMPARSPVHRTPSPGDGQIRRACLFAGYDPEDKIDDYVVHYVEELSRHAEVFYLADGQMAATELDKLRPFVKGAWSVKHGAYDFGSYAWLAKELVGWERLEEYDEVLLVNDSSYLLGCLDDVFEAMTSRACDWWGLQATKGIAATRFARSNLFTEPIPMDVVLDELLTSFESDYTYDFLIGSYFLALRKDVIRDEEFRRFFGGIRKQRTKKAVVQQYEIGLTRLLLYLGYRPATYVEDLYPFHPIFSGWYFVLLDQGFPLLKRYLLTQNHYDIPNLHLWEQRVIDRFPDVDIKGIKANVSRHLPVEEWRDRWHSPLINMLGPDDADRLVAEGSSTREADVLVVKDRRAWVFLLDATASPVGDLAMLLAEIKRATDISTTVVTLGDRAPNWVSDTPIVAMGSSEATRAILCSSVVLADGSSALSAMSHFAAGMRLTIELSPLEIFDSSRGLSRNENTAVERAKIGSIALAETAGEALRVVSEKSPLSFHDVWVTGHPRRDLYSIDSQDLPEHLREAESRMGSWVAERSLILLQLMEPDLQTVRAVVDSCGYAGACAVVVSHAPDYLVVNPRQATLPEEQIRTLEPAQQELTLAAARFATAVITDSPSVAFEMAASGIRSLLLDNEETSRAVTIFGADWLALEVQGKLRSLTCDNVRRAVQDLLTASTNLSDQPRELEPLRAMAARPVRSQRVIQRLRHASTRLPFTRSLILFDPGAV